MRIRLKIMLLLQSEQNMEKVETLREESLWRSILCRGQELSPCVQVSLGVLHRATSWTRWSSSIPSNSADSMTLSRCRGVLISLQEQLDQKELPLNKSHEQAQSLWVKIRTGPTRDTLCLVSVTACLTRGTVLTRRLFSATGIMVLRGSHPSGGLQPPGELLKKQYSRP